MSPVQPLRSAATAVIGVDAALIVSAKSGDTSALEQLIGYARHQILHYSRARLTRFVGGVDIADDVTQEACLAVCKMLGRFSVPECAKETVTLFHGWMYAIARAKVADGQRKLMRNHEPIDDFPESVDLRPTPEEAAMSTFGVSAIGGMLAMLPDKTRQVIMLRAHGYSAEAAGHHLGMTASAVRTAQHRGLARLRQLADSDPAMLDLAS